MELENKENYHGGFQQQSPQRLDNVYRHIMGSQNDRWLIQLKLIQFQAEYYSIENQKSYSIS